MWIVEKAEVIKCGISQGKISLREHRTLYRMLIGILTEHLDLGSRSRRGSGDMGDTGENIAAAPMYRCYLHQCRTGFLTSNPSPGTVEEQGSGGDAALGGKPTDG